MRSRTASGVAVQVAVMRAPQAVGRAAIEICSGLALLGRDEASSGRAKPKPESALDKLLKVRVATEVSRGQDDQSQPRWHPQRHVGKTQGPLDRDANAQDNSTLW